MKNNVKSFIAAVTTLCMVSSLCGCKSEPPIPKKEPVSNVVVNDAGETVTYSGKKTVRGSEIKFCDYFITSKYTDDILQDEYSISGYGLSVTKAGEKFTFRGKHSDMVLTDEEGSVPKMDGDTFSYLYGTQAWLSSFADNNTLNVKEDMGITTFDLTDTKLILNQGQVYLEIPTEDGAKKVGIDGNNFLFGNSILKYTVESGAGMLDGKGDLDYEELPKKTFGKQLIKLIEPETGVHVIVCGDATQQIYTQITLVEAGGRFITPKVAVYNNASKTCYVAEISEDKAVTYSQFVFDKPEALLLTDEEGKKEKNNFLNVGKGVIKATESVEDITGTTFTYASFCTEEKVIGGIEAEPEEEVTETEVPEETTTETTTTTAETTTETTTVSEETDNDGTGDTEETEVGEKKSTEENTPKEDTDESEQTEDDGTAEGTGVPEETEETTETSTETTTTTPVPETTEAETSETVQQLVTLPTEKVSNIVAICYDTTNQVKAELEYHNEFADRHSFFTVTGFGENSFVESLKLQKTNTADGDIENAEDYEQTFEYITEYGNNGAFNVFWKSDKFGKISLFAKTAAGKEIDVQYGWGESEAEILKAAQSNDEVAKQEAQEKLDRINSEASMKDKDTEAKTAMPIYIFYNDITAVIENE